MIKPKAIRVVWDGYAERFWGPDEVAQLESLVALHPEPMTPDKLNQEPDLLRETEIIIGSWGMPVLDKDFLSRAPNLKAIFYAAGSVRKFVNDAFWQANLTLTHSSPFNAVPVAEYCVGAILFSLKCGFRHMRAIARQKAWTGQTSIEMPGVYKSKVGLISLGMIGRKTCELLQPYDLDLLVYSTSLTGERAAEMGVKPASLEEIFQTCSVVSLHTALLPATAGMIRGHHIARMKPNSTFLNTSRGAVVNQSEMLEVLGERPDISAILDVTDPEPPPLGDPILDLPNVFITPHISGSMFTECRRLGQNSVDECRRYLNSEPLHWQVTQDNFKRMA